MNTLSSTLHTLDRMWKGFQVRLVDKKDQFLMNPFGLLYHEVTASSLVKVDMQVRHTAHIHLSSFAARNVSPLPLHLPADRKYQIVRGLNCGCIHLDQVMVTGVLSFHLPDLLGLFVCDRANCFFLPLK